MCQCAVDINMTLQNSVIAILLFLVWNLVLARREKIQLGSRVRDAIGCDGGTMALVLWEHLVDFDFALGAKRTLESGLHGSMEDGIDRIKLVGGSEDGIRICPNTRTGIVITIVENGACACVIGGLKNGGVEMTGKAILYG